LLNAFTQLNDLCGISDTTLYGLTAPVINQAPRLQQFNYEQKFQLDSMSVIAQQEVFNTKYHPQVAAYGNTGLNAVDAAYIPHSIGMSAGLHLYIPIYDGNLKKTVEQQNKLLMQNTQQYNLTTATRIQNNLNNFQQQINLTSQSLSLLNSQLSTQETLLQILKDKVVIGQISVTDYLIAIQNYAETNKNKIQAQAGLLFLINQYNYVNW
jgi:outer membrane protein TolC